MKMLIGALTGTIAIAVGVSVLAANAPDDAKQDLEITCSAAATASIAALDARTSGVSEDMAMGILREKGVYSGIMVWAVKAAYDAPAGVPEALLRGSVFRECLNRNGV